MDKVIRIIMDRDSVCKEEARDIVEDTMAMVRSAIEDGDFMEAEQIFMDELGLEPDYLLNCIM